MSLKSPEGQAASSPTADDTSTAGTRFIAAEDKFAYDLRHRDLRHRFNPEFDMPAWTTTHHREMAATPEAIWRAFADAGNWPRWNAGVASLELEGPFATGTSFTMELPDGQRLRSRLAEVVAPHRFVDETPVDEVTVRVEHRIEPIEAGRCRVVYAVRVEGPGANEIGPAVSEDFPQVLAALAAHLARQR
jgi:uncharacterized protein YndB with AHSA1/START domain